MTHKEQDVLETRVAQNSRRMDACLAKAEVYHKSICDLHSATKKCVENLDKIIDKFDKSFGKAS